MQRTPLSLTASPPPLSRTTTMRLLPLQVLQKTAHNMSKITKTSCRYNNHSDASVRTIAVTIDTSAAVSLEARNQQLRSVALEFCPFLITNDASKKKKKKKDDSDLLEVKPLEGGLSNELFVVQNRTNRQTAVLVRIHPPPSLADGGVEIVNRDTENRLVAWLSSNSSTNSNDNDSASHPIAPAYYGRFTNGRVEEFYDNHVPLHCSDMSHYGPATARLMARMHNCHHKIPVSVLAKNENNVLAGEGGDIFRAVDQWRQFLLQLLQLTAKTHQDDASDAFRLELETEWKWLKSALLQENKALQKVIPPIDGSETRSIAEQATAFIHEIVLTHGDCQSLNLLRPASTSTTSTTTTPQPDDIFLLKLIDFEYAGWNARATDIANTFCEYCDMNNLKAVYETEYPSVAAQCAFLQSYLDTVEPSPVKHMTAAERETFVKTLMHEIGRYTLVSHLGWAIWSLVQHRLSSIDFDYIAYAQHRMVGYRYFKQRYWNE